MCVANIWHNWRRVQGILTGLHRHDEFTRLVQWAKRKHLPNSQRSYQYKLMDEEVRLNRYAIQFPHLMRWARGLYIINKLVTTSPKYYAKGSGAKFRRQY
jgi:hypothetical protein